MSSFEEFLAKQLQGSGASDPTTTSPDALQKEWESLDLYKVAANVHEDRDPSQMGRIEQLLHKGDSRGLRSLLGEELGTEIERQYLDAARQVDEDRMRSRSWGEAAQDLAVGIFASLANTYGAANIALAGAVGDTEYMKDLIRGSQKFNKDVDSLLSDTLKGRRRIKQALDTVAQADHAAQAEAEAYAGGGVLVPPLKRIAKDASTAISNTASDPVLLAQDVGEAIVSAGTAWGAKVALKAGAKAITRRVATKYGIELGEEAAKATSKNALAQLGKRTIQSLDKNLEALSWAGSNALLEGSGAFQEAASTVLNTKIEDLERTSEPFRKLVEEVKKENKDLTDNEAKLLARDRLAVQAGRWAGGLTGATAAGLSHLVGQAGRAPLQAGTGRMAQRTSKLPLAFDMIEEGIEEGSQGLYGGLIGNQVIQSLVDPGKDILDGVGAQIGEGALLGALAAGSMKAPGTVLSAPGQAVNALSKRAARLDAKVQASSEVSPENVIKRGQDLISDADSAYKFAETVMTTLENTPGIDQKAQDSAFAAINELVNSPTVTTLPSSYKNLSSEHQAKFSEGTSRAEAIELASQALLEEKDANQKTELALFLNELMEPVRRFQQFPEELQQLKSNEEVNERFGVYQGFLADIEQLPNVQKALAQSSEILQPKTQITIESLKTPEGQKAAQTLAAAATVNPALNENVSSEAVQILLTHGVDGSGGGLTPTQRRALQGSLGLLQAREAFEAKKSPEYVKELMRRHMGTERTQEAVGRQVTVEADPTNMDNGKYSARQHTDRVIRAMMTGDVDMAKAYLNDFALFVEHHQNKVEALNLSHQRNGQKVAYKQLLPSRDWADSATNPKSKHKYLWVEPKSSKSISLAQEVGSEAEMLFEILKGLTKAYPELGVKLPKQHKLVPAIKNVNTSKMAQKQEKKASKPQPKSADQLVTEAISQALKSEEKPAPKTQKNEVKQPKNEIKTEVEKTEPKQDTAKQVIESLPDTTKSIETLAQNFFGLSEQKQLEKLYLDVNTGGLNARAFEDLPAMGLVAHISVEGTKFVNDNAGHNKGNDLYREAGRALSVAHPLVAKVGGDFAVRVKNQAELDRLLKRANAVGQLHGLQLTGSIGKTLKEAAENHTALKIKLEQEGKRAPRGEKPLGFKGDVSKVEFGNGSKAKVKVPDSLKKRFDAQKKNPTDLFKRIFIEKGTGILTGEAFYALPRKAYQASIDLNWLKQINTLGEVNGDLALEAFGKLAHALGGLEVDFAHVSGDEYLAQSNDSAQLQKFLERLQEKAGETKLVFQEPTTGEKFTLSGLLFGYGIGETLEKAEAALNVQKQQLEDAGLRGIHAAEAFQSRLTRGDARDGQAGTEVQTDGSDPARPEVTTLFPKLLQIPGKIRNFTYQALKFRPDATRLVGKEGSAKIIREAITSAESYRKHLGEKVEPRGTLSQEVIKAYQNLLRSPSEQALNIAKRWLREKNQGKWKLPEAMKSVAGLTAFTQANLEAFLQKEWKKGVTWEEAIRKGDVEPTIMMHGKVFNIVELDDKGQFVYNPELIQQASMAALQWHLTVSQREVPEWKQEENAEALLGSSDLESLDISVIQRLSAGESPEQIKIGLSGYIRRFWGVQGMKDQGLGFTDGIIEAVAAELVRSLVELDMVRMDSFKLKEVLPADFEGDFNPEKRIIRYIAVPFDPDSPLYAYPELLEEAVVTEPEFSSFYGDEEVPVVGRQLSNPQVKLSKKTKQAVESMQKVEHFLNMPFVKGLLKLGEEQIIELFGTPLPPDGATQEALYNKKHLATLKGQNLSIIAAFQELQKVYEEMENVSKAKNLSIEKLGKKYQYVVNSVNRIMMRGAHNPQASKLMREALLPTWSTLDLSSKDSPHYQYFMLAVAQALGHKIHWNSLESNVQWAEETTEKLMPVMDVLAEYLESDRPFPVAEFQKAMKEADVGIPITPLTVNALIQVTRLGLEEDLKNFRTPLYLESDGMTNGPFNAMGLLAVGEVTPEDIASWRRGGLSVGKTPMTADKLRQLSDEKDLYAAGAEKTQVIVAKRFQEFREMGWKGKKPIEVSRALFTAMSFLLGKEVVWDTELNEWKFDRNLTKNPITQLVYGAGTKTIALSIAHKMQTAFAEKLSILARVTNEGGSEADAAVQMFPKAGSPQMALHQWNTLQIAMDEITRHEIRQSKQKGTIWHHYQDDNGNRIDNPSAIARLKRFGPQKFEFNQGEVKRLSQNLDSLLVTPMEAGIQEVLGNSVFDTRKTLIGATSLQSSVARELYLEAILNKVQEKTEARAKELNNAGMDLEAAKKKAHSEVSSEFLSREELNDIFDRLVKDGVMPVVNSDGQSFLITKNALLEFWDNAKNRNRGLFEYSRNLNEGHRTAPVVKAVKNSGVSAVPYLTIGMGDARMVRQIFQEALERSMQVFDGINIPVDKIPEFGGRINMAALYAWRKGNVLQDVLNVYEKFYNHERVQSLLADLSKEESEISPENIRILRAVPDLIDAEEHLTALQTAALHKEARNIALRKFDFSMDQMAGTFQPYVTEGGLEIPEGANDEQIARLINEEYQKALEELKKRRKEKTEEKPQEPAKSLLSTVFEGKGRKLKSGVRVLSKTATLQLFRDLKDKISAHEREVLGEILRSGSLGGTQIVVGTREEVSRYQEAKGFNSLAQLNERNPGKTIYGYYSPVEKTIYLMDPQVETLVHELIHASTYSTIEAYYEGKNLGAKAEPVKEAIQRLESLMKHFLESDLGIAEDSPAGQALRDAQQEIFSHLPLLEEASPTQKAAALNEFMAWTLANQELAKELSKKETPKLIRIVKAAFQAIKKLVWGRKTAPTFGEDFLSQVRFNTAIISRAAPSIEHMVRDISLMHAVLNGTETTPSRLQEVMEVFARKVARHLTQTYSAHWLKTLGTNQALGKQYALATQVTQAAEKVFPLTPEARDAFQMMVLAFATGAEINPHAMIEAQKIYEHFIKNLDPDDFLTGTMDENNDRAQAIDKFEFLSGHTIRKYDPQGRTTILPVFLALATVSDEFRAVLAKKELPKTERGKIVGMDSAIDVAGDILLDKLEDHLSGTNQPENVKVAIDQLTQGVIKNALESKSRLEQALEASGRMTYGLNAKVRDLLSQLGEASLEKGKELGKSNSKFVQSLGSILQVVSILGSDESATAVSEDLLSRFDKAGGKSLLKDLFTDMVGRVPSQAEIYDMVNRVRYAIAQARQNFREKVPAVLNKKFKQKLNKDQWNTLYQMMGRYDLASLLETHSVKEALELAGDPSALAQEISRLENELKSSHPQQAAKYMAKINQYVNFVQTGVYGNNLLRNAFAISELLGEKKNEKTWKKPSKETVQAIDQLITLKLLEKTSPRERAQYQNLLKNEQEGLEFVLSFLKGLRRTEMEKASQGPAKYNHYKGILPFEKLGRGEVVVVDSSNHAKMLEMGYIRLGSYKGSSLENRGISKSYYFSSEGQRTAFQQGIIQNVQQTAYGVHQENGFSLGPSAGRITDPVMVKHLAERMHREAPGTETLAPIYAENGTVVGFERTLDPKYLKHIEQPQNLAKMMGVWQGRQLEEVWAQGVNEALLDRLFAMWEQDKGTDQKDRYVNLLDLDNLDPVVRDAVSIFSPQFKAYAQSKFGDGKLMVRRNLLDMTIGYRNASVGDFWTGNTRYKKETQEAFKQAAKALLGHNAYVTLVRAERNIQAVMASVRTNIVVRSLVVPLANFTSGIYQLRARGVPLLKSLKAVPGKVAEIEFYVKSMSKKVELEAERYASEGNIQKTRAIDMQIKTLEDSLKRLSIWPLIEAGEFSTISDVGQTAEDLDIGPNNIVEKLEAAVDALPPSLRDLARQGYMAKDTALFQALQKSVQYSDFIMKSIYYDHMIKVEKTPVKKALGRISEEFINYNIPTGRTRGYIESMGMAWFLNYKIRSVKIGLSMIRNNPVDLLLYTLLPTPFASGIPVTDNLFASLFRTFGYSIGPFMAFEPIALNPWYNLIAD